MLQVPEAFADPKTAELQKKLGELTAKAAQLDVNYGSENPQVQEIRQQIEAVEKQLQTNRVMLEEKFKADYDRALRDEQEFKAAFEEARAEAVEENQAAIQYNILQQEVETAKSLYKDFLQKTNQTNFELAREYNNLRVVEPAREPKVTVGPQRKQWMLLGFLLSLVIGVGLAVLLDYFDKSIKNIDDISRYVQLPALAVIPVIGTSARRLLWAKKTRKLTALDVRDTKGVSLQIAQSASSAYYNNQPAAEAYRLLRTSVVLSVDSDASKTILITSSQPGEGKTTTTINTAISMAQFGASVLIIDCDLRTPRAHEALGACQEPGLTTYLSGQGEIDDLIQELRIPGLSFLASGPVPSTPAELLSSEKMKELLDLLEERYDFILIDSPPMINLADTIILSTMVDGVLLIVHGGKSNRDMVRRARQELANVGANILGVVLNNVDPRIVGYNSYNS